MAWPKAEAQAYAEEIVRLVKAHITAEIGTLMADINASLDRLSGAISVEIQQVRDAVQGIIDGLTAENADLRAQLEAQVAALDGAVTRVDSLSADLEANDPAPEPPAGETSPA